MMSRLDGFENSIRNSLDQFEVPYNSADWTKLEDALDKEERGIGKGGFGLYAALLAGALAIGTGAIWLANSNSQPTIDVASTTNGQMDQRDATLAITDQASENSAQQSPDKLKVEPSTPRDDEDDHISETSIDEGTVTTASKRAVNEPRSGSNTLSGKSKKKGEKSVVTTGANSSNKDLKGNGGKDAAGATDLSFKSTMTEGCPGSSVEFVVENMPEDGIYLWNFGDGSFSNKPNPSHVYDKPGSYEVNLSITTASGGTILNKPASDKIEIFNAPRASFIPQDRGLGGGIPHKHFENRSRNASKWQWSFGDGRTSREEHPTHVYKQKGVYNVELIATNTTGCQDRYSRELVVDADYDLGATLAFNPKDDSFMPEKLRDLNIPFKLSIYEQTGRKVYETSDAAIAWNGKVNNRNESCAPGEYVWMVEFSEKLAEVEETFNGKVTLLK